LRILNEGRRLGLNELLKVAKINPDKPLESWNVGWQIGPRLNAASRLSHANTAFALLSTTDPEEAKELANELNQRNISRQEITEEIISQVEAQIDKANLPKLIIGVAGEDQIWNEGVIGLVAGKITERYHRPSLIISRLVEAAEFDPQTKKLVPKKVAFKGSGRSIEGFNLIAAIESCSEFLEKFGGHPMACGFSVSSPEKLASFLEKLGKLADTALEESVLVPKLKIEAEIPFTAIEFPLAEALGRLAPFGQNNPQPRFVSRRLRIDDIMTMGFDGKHIKMRFSQFDERRQETKSFWGLAFGGAESYKDYVVGNLVDLAYYLEINEFNGRRELQLKIIDLQKNYE
jgi:single-stranded-DNA-specific exonuclease